MTVVASPLGEFPLAEGLGVFVGVAAWDLLAEGRIDIVNALLIAAPCTLAWYGVQLWREQDREEKEKNR